MRKIDKIILHCSATPEGKHFTVEDIRRWHTNPVNKGGRGWSDIGYHYVVYLDGTVHVGRPEEKTGAHCAGHNRCSIGVCYIGGCAAEGKRAKDTRTPAQKLALRRLVADLQRKYPGALVFCHHHFNPHKACPSFTIDQF